ncbi:hypothetical protein BVC80_761g7 [Macleaya cordata]|uniref:Cyclin-dependent kinase inhibitor n=1 Tax=Macleaya cordata TaxID=56857 RepID=A0A200QXI3_MACCD|nr:hypothetical protein BVC80_761g7 [Macleaya cordata]
MELEVLSSRSQNMAQPSGGRRRRRRISPYKRKLLQSKKSGSSMEPACNSSTTTAITTTTTTTTTSAHEISKIDENEDGVIDVSNEVCSTPKGQKYRIPEILSCPPAPMKKRKVVSHCLSSSQRSPISFFTNPDIELFFFFALHDISV